MFREIVLLFACDNVILFESILRGLPAQNRPDLDPEHFYELPEYNGTHIGGIGGRDPTFETHDQEMGNEWGSKKVAKKFDDSDLAAELVYRCKCRTSNCLSRFNLEQMRAFRTMFWVEMRPIGRKKFFYR